MPTQRRDLWENPPEGYRFMWTTGSPYETPRATRILAGPVRKDGRRAVLDRYQYSYTGDFSRKPTLTLILPRFLYETEADAWREIVKRAEQDIRHAEDTITKLRGQIAAAATRLAGLEKESTATRPD